MIGDRTDGHANNNRLQVDIPSSCVDGKEFGFVRNDDLSYQGILSMLLASKMSKTPIRLMVDDSSTTSNAVRIIWVNFQ